MTGLRAAPFTLSGVTQSFIDLFVVRELEAGRYRGEPHGSGFLYGGLTMGLALTAAARTADEAFEPMSLGCKFLSVGEWGALDIAVEEVSTSRSFAVRRVAMSQGDRVV